MKGYFLYTGLFFLLAGCVSKKKYDILQAQHNMAVENKNNTELVLDKLLAQNDSLRKEVAMKDSIYRALYEKQNMAAAKAEPVRMPTGKVNPKPATKEEYEKKALYIYNIPSYISWPESIQTDNFLIGVIGNKELRQALENYVIGRSIRKMPVVIEEYQLADKKFYHVVFISQDSYKQFAAVKKALENQPVLLITENEVARNQGAHINFYMEGNKVRFKVNQKAIEKAKLNVSSQLIRFSEFE